MKDHPWTHRYFMGSSQRHRYHRSQARSQVLYGEVRSKEEADQTIPEEPVTRLPGTELREFQKTWIFLKFWNFKIEFCQTVQWIFIRASEESLSCAASITFLPQKTANILNSVQKERATEKTNNTPCSILRNFACILYLHHVTFPLNTVPIIMAVCSQ